MTTDPHSVIVDRNGKRLTYGDVVATRSGRQYTVRNWFGEGTVLLEPYPTRHHRRSQEVPAGSLTFIASVDLRVARLRIRHALKWPASRSYLPRAVSALERADALGRDTPADIRAAREQLAAAIATLEEEA